MMRRIALVSEHASPLATLGGVDNGGQNVYVAQIARHLAAKGHQVDVFTRKDRKELPEIVEWEKRLRVIHVPAGPERYVRKEDMLKYMDDFTRYMQDFINKQGRYDLIHANFWMSGLVAADLKAELSIPFVVTFHALGRVRRIYQGKADGFPEERIEIEDRIIREADGIIAECPQDLQDLVELYQADASKITIVPGGFDPDEVWSVSKSIARRVLGISPDEKIVLQLGRLVPRKGVDIVVRGFAQAIREFQTPAKLIIVGGESNEPDPKITPEIGRLQKIAAEEKVSDWIIFAGRKQRRMIKYYYSAADVFVTTPWYEPFGITPLEAMACGTPVIGSAVGGIQYTVMDGITGFLVPANDAVALAERLGQLLLHPELCSRLGAQGEQRVYGMFTWEKVTDAINNIYEHVICAEEEVVDHQQQKIELIVNRFAETMQVMEQSKNKLAKPIVKAAEMLSECLLRGNKVLVCGNGGSAADAQHFAAELVGRFMYPNRPALPVIALNTDTSILTAWANDIGFEFVFSRQVEALAQPGDLLIGISTSGKSSNLVEAFRVAKDKGVDCLAITGGDGGDMADRADFSLVVPAEDSQRIQEVHIFLLHEICELVEEQMVLTSGMVATEFTAIGKNWTVTNERPIEVSIEKPDDGVGKWKQ